MAIFPRDLARKKQAGEKIVALTAYDFPFAALLDQSGVDVVLVGDTLGVVVQGQSTTLPVTLDEMIYHSRMVKRGIAHALLVVDLPFLSYQPSVEEAIRSAGRLLKEGGAGAVKLEGGEEIAETTHRLTSLGIPVIGHLGLTPQSYHALGGHRVQGRSADQAERILHSAKVIEETGASAVVLEGIPEELGKQISEALVIPTIGIGAGRFCDGQILVLHDLLGISADAEPKYPRFVKCYRNFSKEVRSAVSEFASDVRTGKYPGTENIY